MSPTLGQRLRRAREERGWNIEDLAYRTRIPVQRLRELEQDNLHGSGSLIYAKSFLKKYAALLEVDAREVLSQIHSPPLSGSRDYHYLLELRSDSPGSSREWRKPSVSPVRSSFQSPRSTGLALVLILISLSLIVTLWRANARSTSKTTVDPSAQSTLGGKGATQDSSVQEGEPFTVFGATFNMATEPPAPALVPRRKPDDTSPPPRAIPVE